MEFIFSWLMLMNSWLVIGLKSPQWVVVSLIFQTIFMAVLVGLSKSVWYSYVLFLIFLGGLLVLFVYISSLIPKIKLEYYLNKSYYMMIMVLSSFLMVTGYESFSEKDMLFGNSMLIFSGVSFDWSMNTFVYIVIYLLLSLSIIGWMIKIYEGPLRLLKV